MERRAFLKRLINFSFSILVLIAGSVLVYIYPSKMKERKLHYVYLIDEDELPKRGVRKMEFKYKSEDIAMINRAYLVISDNSMNAFSPVCTHLGCFVNWDNNKMEFICPCHGGKYNQKGEVTAGPPSRPLTKLPLKVMDGKVYLGIKI